MNWHGRSDGRIAWAAAASAAPGQDACGDVHVAAPFRGGFLCGVIDGLGHGRDAQLAAEAARATLVESPARSLESLIAGCHEALRRLRGAVLSLASFDFERAQLTWLGVGNVEGVVVRASGAPRERLLLRGGVVGHTLPPLRVASMPMAGGDTLVFASDGIDATFADVVHPRAAVSDIADRVLATHATGSDDAMVLAVRVVGASA